MCVCVCVYVCVRVWVCAHVDAAWAATGAAAAGGE